MRWDVAIGTLVIRFRAPCLPNKVLLSRSENEVPGSLLFWSPPSPIWVHVALTFPKEAILCTAGTGRHRVRSRKKKQDRRAEIKLLKTNAV